MFPRSLELVIIDLFVLIRLQSNVEEKMEDFFSVFLVRTSPRTSSRHLFKQM